MNGGDFLRSGWVPDNVFLLLLTALMPENRLALLVSMHTGLRIGDVLQIRTEQIKRQRFTVREQKTGKIKKVFVPVELWRDMNRIAGRRYVFEGRLDWRKPRTRSAVYKDLRRVCELYRLDGKAIRAHLSPHSARKIYAVRQMRRYGIERVKELLNHESEAVTMLYAMADVLEESQEAHKAR